MGTSQQFSLRWNNYLKHITSAFDTLRTDEDLVDVTLSCEGKRIRAHKMLLSACSTYFRDLFKENPCQHPVIIFRNVKFDDLAALVDFIYQGEVNVVQEQLDSFMTTAELLAVQGLTDGSRKDDSMTEDDVEIPSEPEVQLRNASGKVMMNDKGSKSPSSPSPYHSTDAKSDHPPNKRRRCRDNADSHSEKSKKRATSPKDPDNGKSDSHSNADPVEIIPLMPNLKLEMPEYLEQDGSSCSYDEHGGDSPSKTLGDNPDIIENDQKPDITNTFYSSASDTLDASKSSDIGYLLSKPGTSSGDRISHEGVGAVGGGRKRRCAAASSADVAASSGSTSTTSTPAAAAAAGAGTSEGQVVMQGPGRFSCSLCGSVYRHLASLTQHLEVHRNQTTCLLCHTTLSRRTDLRRHMRLKHNMQWQKSMHRHRSSRRELNS